MLKQKPDGDAAAATLLHPAKVPDESFSDSVGCLSKSRQHFPLLRLFPLTPPPPPPRLHPGRMWLLTPEASGAEPASRSQVDLLNVIKFNETKTFEAVRLRRRPTQTNRSAPGRTTLVSVVHLRRIHLHDCASLGRILCDDKAALLPPYLISAVKVSTRSSVRVSARHHGENVGRQIQEDVDWMNDEPLTPV
ncbi:unnamed protein product [Pleuronectes platessa]|uniref:Uncharacterized protein n=1 Tax=Pleuronectes platessa TaxID=8262 RepID=A0A9N7VI31_PLEPL|nr:unnamed protein product [Pleuronectes platessa]